MEIGLGKIQGQCEIAVRDSDLGIREASSQVVRHEIDFRKQELLFETVDNFAEDLARGFSVPGNAEFRDETWLGRRGVGQRRGGRSESVGGGLRGFEGRAD